MKTARLARGASSNRRPPLRTTRSSVLRRRGAPGTCGDPDCEGSRRGADEVIPRETTSSGWSSHHHALTAGPHVLRCSSKAERPPVKRGNGGSSPPIAARGLSGPQDSLAARVHVGGRLLGTKETTGSTPVSGSTREVPCAGSSRRVSIICGDERWREETSLHAGTLGVASMVQR